MESIAPNPKYLYDARFRKVEPRKADEVGDNYAKVSLHTHSKRHSKVENTRAQLDKLILYCLSHDIRVCALTDHEKEDINRSDYSITDQRFGQIGVGTFGRIVDFDSRAKTVDVYGCQVTFPKSKEFWAKDSNGRAVHINGIGYEGEIECNRSFPIDYLIKEIRDHNGLVIIDHPFNKLAKGISKKNLEALLKSEDTMPDALEVNSMNVALLDHYNKKTINFGREHKIPLVAGSDAHFPFHIEFGHILTPQRLLDIENERVNDAVKEIIENQGYYNYFRPIPLNHFLQWWVPMALECLPERMNRFADKVRA